MAGRRPLAARLQELFQAIDNLRRAAPNISQGSNQLEQIITPKLDELSNVIFRLRETERVNLQRMVRSDVFLEARLNELLRATEDLTGAQRVNLQMIDELTADYQLSAQSIADYLTKLTRNI